MLCIVVYPIFSRSHQKNWVFILLFILNTTSWANVFCKMFVVYLFRLIWPRSTNSVLWRNKNDSLTIMITTTTKGKRQAALRLIFQDTQKILSIYKCSKYLAQWNVSKMSSTGTTKIIQLTEYLFYWRNVQRFIDDQRVRRLSIKGGSALEECKARFHFNNKVFKDNIRWYYCWLYYK